LAKRITRSLGQLFVLMTTFSVITAAGLHAGEGVTENFQHVNPFIGTDEAEHTFPGATFPFGMVQLSPDTGGNKGFYLLSDWKWCAGYHYDDTSILGFSHIHHSGMGVGDWGDFLFMPTVGKIRTKPGGEEKPEKGYRSRFSHDSETAEPGYYAVTLDDYGIRAELTVSQRAGFHRYTFPASDSSHILIDLGHGLGDWPINCKLKVIGNDKVVATRTSTGFVPHQKTHFCAEFERPFDSFGVWNGPLKKPGIRFEAGRNIGAFLNYSTEKDEEVLVKVGISYTSQEQACKNLGTDIDHWDFDRTRQETKKVWAKELNKIRVSPSTLDTDEETKDRLDIFYTGLYHSFLFPAVFMDADGTYVPMMESSTKKRHADFVYYSDFSLWDTFRSEMPLLSLLQPERMDDMVKTMVRQYENSGWMPAPQQFSNYHTDSMTGDHNACVIMNAYQAGVRDFDLAAAYEGVRKNATEKGFTGIPMIGYGVGRFGNRSYQRRGYVDANTVLAPNNPLFMAAYVFNMGASRTLEYAYSDFCVGWMADELGLKEDSEYFKQRSRNYRNVFDTETGFVRGRSKSGEWMHGDDFNPRAYYAYYTEGNSWQWTWSVFHDVEGLVELMGGREAFNAKLDEFFSSTTNVEAYDLFSVHISGMIGQYVHGNEPSHHIAYLYNFSGQPWKTQKLARQIMDDLYWPEPHGLAGNEDMGQMSSWYVWSAMGLYPLYPGVYLVGSPVFGRVEVDMKDGKVLVIEAENVSSDNKYIQSASINGAPLDRPWIKHSEIANGATLKFIMGPGPNREWGSSIDDRPPSFDGIY